MTTTLFAVLFGTVGGIVAAIFLTLDFKANRTYLIVTSEDDEDFKRLVVRGTESPLLFLAVTLSAGFSALFVLVVAGGIVLGEFAGTDFFAAVEPWLKTFAWIPFILVVVYDVIAAAARFFDWHENADEIQTLGLDD